jgi:hypothetical protein
MSLWRLHSLIIILSLFALAGEAKSQTALKLPYKYDSTFVLGGYDINRVWLLDTAKYVLGMNTIGYYHAPHKLAYTYVTGTDSGAYALYRLLQRMQTLQLKAMYAVGHIPYIGQAARAMEQYPANDYTVVQIPTLQFHAISGAFDTTLTQRQFVMGRIAHREPILSRRCD